MRDDKWQDPNNYIYGVVVRLLGKLMGIRDVLGSKIPRTRMALNVYLKYHFDPFKGRTNYCFRVLALFKKPV